MLAVRTGLKSAVLALALALAPPAAQAAEVSIEVGPGSAVQFGSMHEITGTLTSDGVAGLAGQEVVLEVRPHPFRGAFTEATRTITGADGSYFLEAELDRNHQVRVVAPASGGRSATVRAFTFPRSRGLLSFRQVRPGVVRMIQGYAVPRDVRLRGRVVFYLGRSRARSGTRRATVAVRRLRRGRFRATTTVRVPAAYRGRFRFAACLEVTRSSGMGDARESCPRRYRF